MPVHVSISRRLPGLDRRGRGGARGLRGGRRAARAAGRAELPRSRAAARRRAVLARAFASSRPPATRSTCTELLHRSRDRYEGTDGMPPAPAPSPRLAVRAARGLGRRSRDERRIGRRGATAGRGRRADAARRRPPDRRLRGPGVVDAPLVSCPFLGVRGCRFTEDHLRVYDPSTRRARSSVVLNWATRSPARLVSTVAWCPNREARARADAGSHRDSPRRHALPPRAERDRAPARMGARRHRRARRRPPRLTRGAGAG